MVKPIDVKRDDTAGGCFIASSTNCPHKRISSRKNSAGPRNYQIKTNEDQTETLPQKEFYYYKLLAYPNKIFTRQQLMDEIWGLDSDTDELNHRCSYQTTAYSLGKIRIFD